MADYAGHTSTRQTLSSEPIPGKNQVPNRAGGFGFQLDCWKRLERFLILGNEGGTYYANEKELTISNCRALLECTAENPKRCVDMVVEVSDSGRAPKNDPAIFCLARLAAERQCVDMVAANLRKVCRIGAHIMQFCDMVQHFRGWGSKLRNSVASWYTEQDVDALAFQVSKYRSRRVREGQKGATWSHCDILRKCHAKPTSNAMAATFAWATGKQSPPADGHFPSDPQYRPQIIQAYEEAKCAPVKALPGMIREYGLQREHLPTEALNSPEVWEALLEQMPPHALLRNLGKLASVKLLVPLSEAAKTVTAKLNDHDWLCSKRVHPMAVLMAASIYSAGCGLRGKLTWQPDHSVIGALDDAFVGTFQSVECTGKNHLLAIDISASMAWPASVIAGTFLHAREAAAAMAMITSRTETNTHTCVFSNADMVGCKYGVVPVDYPPNTPMREIVRKTHRYRPGGTNCSLPILYALKHELPVDVFVVYTDNEHWVGPIHPVQALQQYREKMQRPAKLIAVAFAANEYSVADASDPGMLDIVGFDTAAPAVMADFVKSF